MNDLCISFLKAIRIPFQRFHFWAFPNQYLASTTKTYNLCNFFINVRPSYYIFKNFHIVSPSLVIKNRYFIEIDQIRNWIIVLFNSRGTEARKMLSCYICLFLGVLNTVYSVYISFKRPQLVHFRSTFFVIK